MRAISTNRRASGSRSGRRPSWAVLASLWAVLVWMLLTWPPPPSAPDLGDWLLWPLARVADKLGHAALFLVQTLLLHRALHAEGRSAGGRALAAAVALAILYGGVTELRQRGVERREADPWDFAADDAGALGYAVALRRSRLRERVAARRAGGGARGLAGRRGGG